MSSSSRAPVRKVPDPIRKDIRLLFALLRRDFDKSMDDKWPESEFAKPGAYYLIADGLATCSLASCAHWLEFVRNRLSPEAFGDFAGFSFFRYGRHYARKNTAITFGPKRISRLTTRYLTKRGTSVVYVTFSLSGPLFILGIALAIAEALSGSKSQPDAVKELILVQPALKVREAIIEGIAEFKKEYKKQHGKSVAVPEAVESIIYHQEVFEGRILEALRVIRERDIPVTMLYWDRDAFLEYSDDFRDSASALGVQCKQVTINPSDKLGPFQMHNQVARSDEIANALTGLLHSF